MSRDGQRLQVRDGDHSDHVGDKEITITDFAKELVVSIGEIIILALEVVPKEGWLIKEFSIPRLKMGINKDLSKGHDTASIELLYLSSCFREE